jgi:hypothetical protein
VVQEVTDELSEEFVRMLMDLRGKLCWSFYAGPSTGSDIDLDFGRKLPRIVPMLGNQNLTEDQKFYESELSLFVQCAWRLDSGKEVVCGSTDANGRNGPMVAGLQAMIGSTVERVAIQSPAFDLTLMFRDGLYLKVFCDQTNVEEGDSNYSLHTRDRIYIVGPRGRVRIESTSGQAPGW